MLGGLIAGALGGGASAASSIADRVLKEADEAKKRAEQMGLITLQRQWNMEDKAADREFQTKQADTKFERDTGLAVLSAQMADNRSDKDNKVKKEISDSDNATRVEIAKMGETTATQKSSNLVLDSLDGAINRISRDITATKRLLADDPTSKSAQMALEDLTREYAAAKGSKQAYLIKNGKVSAEEYAVEFLGKGYAPERLQAAIDQSTVLNKDFGARLSELLTPEISKAKPTGAKTSAAPVTRDGTNPVQVRSAYNDSIRTAMANIQEDMRRYTGDPAKLNELASKYTEYQGMLK